MGNSQKKAQKYNPSGSAQVFSAVSNFFSGAPSRTLAEFATTKLSDGTTVTPENVCRLYTERKDACVVGKGVEKKEKDDDNDNEGTELNYEKDAEKLFTLILDRFDQIRASKEGKDGLLSLRRDHLISLLESDNLMVAEEYDVLLFLGAWADRRIEEEQELQVKEEPKAEKADEKVKGGDDGKKPPEATEAAEPKKDDVKKEEAEETKRRILSDSDFARQLQDEMNSERLDREAEDEILARELQRILNEDDNNSNNKSTPAPVVAVPPKDDADIPYWKLSDAYMDRLREITEPLMEYIRFPQMQGSTVASLDEQGIIPHHLIHEALRHLHHIGMETYKPELANPRLRPRGYSTILEWNPAKKSSWITISSDLRTVTATTSCGHKTVLAKRGFSGGSFSFEVLLEETAGCYSAVGVAAADFPLDGGVLGVNANSWAVAMYPGSHSAQGDRRKWLPSQQTKGTRIRLHVDLDNHTMGVYLNDSLWGTLTGVTGMVYPALTMCHTSPAERYKLVNCQTHV